jgi:hypothetical protein
LFAGDFVQFGYGLFRPAQVRSSFFCRKCVAILQQGSAGKLLVAVDLLSI